VEARWTGRHAPNRSRARASENPDIVYVAALGHIFGPNDQRGVFRSKDGGKTWDKILSRGNKAGAIDLIIDPSNANVLYAGFWEVYRKPWTLESGGPGGGIFKSTDGGDTWTELTRNQGLPRGTVGKIDITVRPRIRNVSGQSWKPKMAECFVQTTAVARGRR